MIRPHSWWLISLFFLLSACNRASSLTEAVAIADLRSVQALLEAGADPNQKDEFGRPVLVRAAQDHNAAIVEILVRHGANVEATYGGVPALFFATLEGKCSLPILKTLLDAGASPDVFDPIVHSAPILNSAEAGDLACVTTLLGAGADALIENVRGENLAYHAALSGELSVIEAVAAIGVPLDSRSSYGVTPLMVAAAGDYRDVAEFLIREGADQCTVDVRGRTPRDVARKNYHEELANVLRTCTETN